MNTPAPDQVFTAFCEAGLWTGLGTSLAAALPEAGIRLPEDVTAARLAELPKVGTSRAGRLFSAFLAARPVYDLVVPLLGAGLSARLAGRAVDVFGDGAPRLLGDDPWRLLSLIGVEVADADAFARAVLPGVAATDPRRSRALVAHVLGQQAREGHTVCELETVRSDLAMYRVTDLDRAIADACASELVSEVTVAQVPMLALARYEVAETSIAEAISRLIKTAVNITAPTLKNKRVTEAGESLGDRIQPPAEDVPVIDSGLDAVQRTAVANVLSHGVSVLTGGPGTGKSRTVAEVVREVEKAGKTIALAAPTGRAAKRLSELCDAEATTIHRLLGVQPRAGGFAGSSSGDVDFSAGFARGTEWPLDQDVIVVDEASMLDVELAAALLLACADRTHLLIVGDPAQLPSIGPGQVLADLIASGAVPVVQLQTLYRQDAGGAIARLATAVRQGELPQVDSPDREVVIVAARGSAECAHRVVQLMTDSIPRALGIAAADIQVVTPVHRGPAGTIELNQALKASLNPSGGNPSTSRTRGLGAARFDVGDRVVATANHLEANPVGFANGEVGTVTKIVDRTVTVDFGSGPAEISGKMLADVTHGWAITVHRAQGSEFRAVVVVLPPEAGRMLSRPLVYTGLTRARQHLSVVHGSGPALVRAVRDIGAKPRATMLGALLKSKYSV